MPYSMTAFVRQAHQEGDVHWIWEVRSVNHRFLDVQWRLTESQRVLETILQPVCQKWLKRGRLDVRLLFPDTLRRTALLPFQNVDWELLKGLYSQAKKTFPDLQIDFVQLLRFWESIDRSNELSRTSFSGESSEYSGVWQTKIEGVSIASLVDSFEQALRALSEQRGQEGSRLRIAIEQRMAQLRQHLKAIDGLQQVAVDKMRQQFLLQLQELKVDIDPGRLEQELVFWAQKLDIAEEIDRLRGHLDALSLLWEDAAIGRRLDVLCQELHREVNTLGVKAQEYNVIQHSMAMKLLIEQIREQAQNLE